MQVLKVGVLYFVLVFGIGFVLGTIRTLWVAPRVGVRAAELMETPVMLVVTIAVARWGVRGFALPDRFCPPAAGGIQPCPVDSPHVESASILQPATLCLERCTT